MATYTKELFTNSSAGRPILVAGTNTTTATFVHVTGTSNTIIDEVWLYAVNSNTAQQTLSIEFGGSTSTNDIIPVAINPSEGMYICIPGVPITGNGTASSNIKAFATVANAIIISGYINRIEP
jgi:hypothetical protein